MKKFDLPEIRVEEFSVQDIVTASGLIESGNENQLPVG